MHFPSRFSSIRVLHVIPYFSPMYGGPFVVLNQMVDALVSHGITVDVATTTANGKFELIEAVGKPVEISGARFFYFPRHFLKSWMFSWSLRQWLYSNVRNYDVVHIHNIFAYPSLPACSAARFFKKPYIITPHGMLGAWCLRQKSWKKIPYYHILEKTNLCEASAIHVTSSFEERAVHALGFSEKTFVIPLSVPSFYSDSISRQSNKNLSLLFMSRIDPVKGLPVLLHALSILICRGFNILLTVAGAGPLNYLSEIRSIVSKLGIVEYVKFVGFVSDQDKSSIFAASDLFVLPSYHENFSIATAEAMAAGLPVIVSDQVGLASDIQKANAGLIVPVDSPVQLSEAILKFADERYRRIVGENGRRLCLERFSKSQLSNSLISLYASVSK